MGTLLDFLGLRPFDFYTVIAFAAGLMLSSAVRDRRDLAVALVSMVALVWPVKVYGDIFGLSGFAAPVWVWPFAPNGDFQFPLRPSPAIPLALFVTVLAMYVWRKVTLPRLPEPEVSLEQWIALRGLCQVVLIIMTPVLHLATVLMVPASVEGLVATLLLPGLSQIYWIAELWPKTATLSHPLTLGCVVWLCAAIIWPVANWMIGSRKTSAPEKPAVTPRVKFPPRPVVKRDAC